MTERLSDEEIEELERNLAAFVGDKDPSTVYFETRAARREGDR